MTEDEVRDEAGRVLGLGKAHAQDESRGTRMGVGQITTFNQLGFLGVPDKPDGWYLPDDRSRPAIVLETKAGNADIDDPKLLAQVEKYCATVRSKYDTVIGIVFNGTEARAFEHGRPLEGASTVLEPKEYYIDLVGSRPIDKNRIHELTMRINNSLHSEFGIKNLYHRMIFTACALVARRYDAILVRGMDYSQFHNGIQSALNKAIRDDQRQNDKLELLTEVYSEIRMNVSTDEHDARAVARLTGLIGDFIDWVTEISGLINSNAWSGEDVMAIFFNEFNRYKKKSESGQVFTPDHITGFMYRLLGVDQNDVVLDACAGSGSFLVKSMSNMISEAGGVGTQKAKIIKQRQLWGIEYDREIFALACANMLIHKDGKTNIAHMDARTESASEWMQRTGATKVLMNPPYENRYGCMKIVENVLSSVDAGTLCGFILPDKKLEKTSAAAMKRILKNNRLTTIVKLPENLFFGVGVTTSIFVFAAGKPQDGEEIFAVNIEEDGLVTVKNKGRQDVHGAWAAHEEYWIDAIRKRRDREYGTEQWLDPAEHLSWQAPAKPFSLHERDLSKVAMDYLMFQRGIDAKVLRDRLIEQALYSSSAAVDPASGAVVIEVER